MGLLGLVADLVDGFGFTVLLSRDDFPLLLQVLLIEHLSWLLLLLDGRQHKLMVLLIATDEVLVEHLLHH